MQTGTRPRSNPRRFFLRIHGATGRNLVIESVIECANSLFSHSFEYTEDYFRLLHLLFAHPSSTPTISDGLRFTTRSSRGYRTLRFEVVRAHKLEDRRSRCKPNAAIAVCCRLGKKAWKAKPAGADQSDAPPPASISRAILRIRAAVRGPAGRGARLHRRLCIPVRETPALHCKNLIIRSISMPRP